MKSFFNRFLLKSSDRGKRDFLAHWAWCLPVLLVVAFLSIRQINLYPPTTDEFYSMYNSGWLVGGPFSPIEVIESLHNNSPNHTPGYFLLLSIWGSLTAYDVALGRVLSVFCEMLFLSMAYRLARDFVAPAAGIFAIILIASNAFFNYYVSHVRMYTLLQFVAGIVLWLYWRVSDNRRETRKTDYFALGAAVFMLLNIHAFSIAYGLVLAAYHMLFVPRDRPWRKVFITVAAAFLISLPWFAIILTEGIGQSQMDWSAHAVGAWDSIAAWLALATNGQPLLLALSAGGLMFASQHGRAKHFPIIALVIIHVFVLGLLTDVTPYVILRTMRHHLPSWLFFVLLMAAGLNCLYCHRRWLGILVLLWVVAGISFQTATEWHAYIAGRIYSFFNPPWQVVAPLAAESDPLPELIGYHMSTPMIGYLSRVDYSPRQHYFDRLGVNVEFAADPHQLKLMLRNTAIISPRIWILYQRSESAPSMIGSVESNMESLEFNLCRTMNVGADTTILDYSWSVLECERPNPAFETNTELISYQFYAAEVDSTGSTLFFADTWSARVDLPLDEYAASYQLISPDWENVAQLDLPMVHEGLPRRFSIDISNVEPGTYRLMAILYNRESGERLHWNENVDLPSDILMLAEVSVASGD